MEKPPLQQRHVVQLLLPIVPRMEQTLPTRYDVQERLPILLPHADLRLLLLEVDPEANGSLYANRRSVVLRLSSFKYHLSVMQKKFIVH